MPKKKEFNITDLREILEKMDDNKSKLALSLLDKAEFMNDTLNKLQARVKKDGVVTKMSQGKYEIERENPALKSYNTTVKNYTNVIKQVVELLPENVKKQDGENLLKFIASGKK